MTKDPAYRKPAPRKHLVRDEDKIKPARVMWAEIGRENYVLYDKSKSTVAEKDGNIGFTVLIKTPNVKNAISLPLAAYTEEEILALKQFWDAVFEEAIPIARRLDEEAAQAHKEGQDDLWRLYRTLPRIVDRRGKEREHAPSVSSGPAGLADVEQEPDGTGSPEAGGELHEQLPEDMGTQDGSP